MPFCRQAVTPPTLLCHACCPALYCPVPDACTVPQMYLPEEGHPAYGVVRTYVKDFNDEPDTPGAQTWLDSGETPSKQRLACAWEREADLREGWWCLADATCTVI